jgi:hypothetical protein
MGPLFTMYIAFCWIEACNEAMDNHAEFDFLPRFRY